MGFFIRVKDFCYYNRKIIIACVLLVLFFSLYIFFENKTVKNDEVVVNNEFEIDEVVNDAEENIEEYIVDIKGAILNPGTYVVTLDNRVVDVINMAGGLLENSDTNGLNLSKKVVDEMIIYVPFIDDNNDFVDYEQSNDNTFNDDKISINNASVSELMNISGIGEVKAKNIVEYRNKNGLFKSIEDIKNVNGIGNSTFEKIKEYIKL